MKLEPEDIETIARRVAELVKEEGSVAVRLVDAAELAVRLAVERDWVYAHAHELGAIRLGGPHGRLRFDLLEVKSRLAPADRDHGNPKRRSPPSRTRSRPPDGAELLPYAES